MRRWLPSVVMLLTCVSAAGAPLRGAPGSLVVTIYRPGGGAPGFALVTDRRRVNVGAGDAELRFEGVAGELDPGSVQLRDLSEPDVQVLEQAFRWDMGSADALLSRYLGEVVTVVTDGGERRGRLRSFDATQIVLESEDPAAPVEIVVRGKGVKDIRFGTPPGGALAARPTLVWKLRSRKPGEHMIEVSYQTTGLSWNADYSVVVGEDGRKTDLSGWLSLQNATDAPLVDATVRLVAGDVIRAAPPPAPGQATLDPNTGLPVTPTTTSPPPLRVYDLPGPVTLPARATRQLELFPAARGLPGKLVYVHEHVPAYAYYYKQQGYPMFEQTVDGAVVKKIDAVGEFLELPLAGGPRVDLPAGKLHVYRRDATTGAVALAGEDNVGHTGKDGALRVRLGESHDLTGERRQVDFQQDERAREMREKFEVHLHNGRKEAVEMVIVEDMFRWRNWAIEGESLPYVVSDDGLKVQFRMKLAAGADQTLTYTARYHTW